MIRDEGIRSAVIVNIVDGDTIDTMTTVAHFDEIIRKERHRLTIINAPEKGTPGAAEATAFVKRFDGQTVQIKTHRKENYGRLLSDVYVTYEGQQESLSSLLLRQGLATVYGK